MQHMQSFVKRCSSIARLFSIGKSAQGRELWALEISSAPGKQQAKPNVRYVANLHGDEPVGRSGVAWMRRAQLVCLQPRHSAGA